MTSNVICLSARTRKRKNLKVKRPAGPNGAGLLSGVVPGARGRCRKSLRLTQGGIHGWRVMRCASCCTRRKCIEAMKNLIAKLVKDEQGGEVLEHVLIAGLVVFAAIEVIGVRVPRFPRSAW